MKQHFQKLIVIFKTIIWHIKVLAHSIVYAWKRYVKLTSLRGKETENKIQEENSDDN